MALSVAWAAALDAWNETLGQQGCALEGEGLSLVVPHTQDAFATWLIVGASALVVFGVFYPLLDLIASRQIRHKAPQGASQATSVRERLVPAELEDDDPETLAKGTAPGTRPTQPDAWDRWFYKGAVCAITLAMGCGLIIHGEGLLQSAQPAFLVPHTTARAEFMLPTSVITGTAPLETVGPHGNRWLTVQGANQT